MLSGIVLWYVWRRWRETAVEGHNRLREAKSTGDGGQVEALEEIREKTKEIRKTEARGQEPRNGRRRRGEGGEEGAGGKTEQKHRRGKLEHVISVVTHNKVPITTAGCYTRELVEQPRRVAKGCTRGVAVVNDRLVVIVRRPGVVGGGRGGNLD
ncbi:hypothetical protein E2C01_042523 [Portunus trituberculatus]|uniref:Uncharacterized protein n=1 Tax=Portunus trituberculatus TaxID=210409 RepID=A0A5B7FTW1_PORTR|nr:hypothetical protein [Portunus trituberculatus]